MDSLDNFDALVVTKEAKSYLNETAKWGKFLAIVGFVMTGLLVILGIFMGTILGTLTSAMPQGSPSPFGGIPGAFISGIYIAIALIYIFPCYYLYNFSTKTKLALQNDDAEILTEALLNHKSMFKFMGIMMAIVLGIYALIFVFAIIGGAFMAAR